MVAVKEITVGQVLIFIIVRNKLDRRRKASFQEKIPAGTYPLDVIFVLGTQVRPIGISNYALIKNLPDFLSA